MSEYIIDVEGIKQLVIGAQAAFMDAWFNRSEHEEFTFPMLPKIVRCRDCEHYDPHCTDDGVCFLPDGDGDFARWEVNPDGFCAWGERREK